MTAEFDSTGAGKSAQEPKTVDLEFESIRHFREVMAPRLNFDGFFIATTEVLPRGTPTRFRFILPDDFVLAEGTGVVAWARREDEGPGRPAGMALLFDQLDQDNRDIIDELVEFQVSKGDKPFDIGPRATQAGDIDTDALTRDPLDLSATDTRPDVFATTGAETPPSQPSSADEVLPDWLSEVAQRHDVNLENDAAETVAPELETDPLFMPPEPEPPERPELDINLVPDEDGPDQTPHDIGLETVPDVTMVPDEPRETQRDYRLRLILLIAVAVVSLSAIVFWLANRDAAPETKQSAVEIEEGDAADSSLARPDDGSVESADAPQTAADEPQISPPAVEPAAPATRVLLVAATRINEGTVVTVRANGDLSERAVRISRLEEPDRVWLKIQGIETFYRPNAIQVDTPEVDKIRVGHHPEEAPPSIYVVADLEDPRAGVLDWTIEGDTLRVVIGRQ
jgi:hypothetical protein